MQKKENILNGATVLHTIKGIQLSLYKKHMLKKIGL